MIDTSVEQRAEGGQPLAGRPRPGRPAPNFLASNQANTTDFIRQSRASTERWHKFDGDPRPAGLAFLHHVCSLLEGVTTAMCVGHKWRLQPPCMRGQLCLQAKLTIA